MDRPGRAGSGAAVGGFLVGNFISGIALMVIPLLVGFSSEGSIWIVFFIETACIGITCIKKRRTFRISLSPFEIVLTLVLIAIAYYLMEKSFSYSNGSFRIASNLYQDFGAHIPFIRSFSLGQNIPPVMPFFSNHPLTYHFLFDFLIGIYERAGIPLIYAFNIVSTLALTSLLLFVFSLSKILFGENPWIGLVAITLTLTNSTTSFIEAFQKYGFHVGNYYHNTTYLGDGPFGQSIVSIFWNLNTYLNQRHFLFAVAISLFITICIVRTRGILVPLGSRIALGIMIGLLPFWNSPIYLITLGMCIGIIIQMKRTHWMSYIPVLIPAILLAIPQVLYIGSHTGQSVIVSPGFLARESFPAWLFYWVRNFGVSILTMPLGVYVAKKESRVLVLPILALFVAANTFQLASQMFDNHKLFNVMIICMNLYSSYLIVWLYKKSIVMKSIACIFLFFLTISGVLDIFVVKNDVKTVVTDYPSNAFMSWVLKNTKSDAVFVTNGDIYDPVTIVGRKTLTGRPHLAFLYGIDTQTDFARRDKLLAGSESARDIYIALYSSSDTPTQTVKTDHEQLRKMYRMIYTDHSVVVYSK